MPKRKKLVWTRADFGRRLAALRRGHGLSRDEFGRDLGTTAATVAQYEQGRKAPGFDRMGDIFTYFGMTPGEFFA